MFSIASIIAIAVNKQVLPERICILIGCAFGESSLEVAEKGLGHSVVPTVAFSTHALHELLFCDDLPEIITGLLHPLVTVNHQPGGRLACADGLPKGGENPFGLKGIAQVPAHDLAGKQVEKHAQVVPFWANSQIGDVRHPNQIGNLELEASLKLIGRNQLTMTALGGEDFTRRT